MCGPRGLKGEPDHLFHNNGDGTFTDVSEKAGVSDKPDYYGLGAVFADVNNDGKPDLLVANDSSPNYLYINKGDGTFEDDSYASGYALNENGRETASMGIAVGDYRNNGLLDLYNTVFSDDYNPLYRNEGDANFSDISYQAGIAEVTIPFLAWGTGFLDYDNDGWKDLIRVERARLSRGRQQRMGHDLRAASVALSQSQGTKVRGRAPGERHRAGTVTDRPRRGLWRPLQRRQDRCCGQSARRATRPCCATSATTRTTGWG